jgi:hypothetical protein
MGIQTELRRDIDGVLSHPSEFVLSGANISALWQEVKAMSTNAPCLPEGSWANSWHSCTDNEVSNI